MGSQLAAVVAVALVASAGALVVAKELEGFSVEGFEVVPMVATALLGVVGADVVVAQVGLPPQPFHHFLSFPC